MSKYACLRCGFIAKTKQKYVKHLSRRNLCEPIVADISLKIEYEKYNIKLPKEKILKQNTIFKCEHCEKVLSTNQILQQHIERCKLKKQMDEENNKQNNEQNKSKNLEDEIKYLKEQLEEQKKMVDMLMKKSGTTNYDNSINSINNNNINFNVQLIAYDKTTHKLSDRDIIDCMRKTNMCIPQLVEKIHLNSKAPQNHNIYISNFRDNHVMIYDGQKWNLTDNKHIIDELIQDKHDMLEEKLDEWINAKKHPEAISRFKKYLNSCENGVQMDNIKTRTKHLLYNNKNMIVSYSKSINK
jgi:hypothetical protein